MRKPFLFDSSITLVSHFLESFTGVVVIAPTVVSVGADTLLTFEFDSIAFNPAHPDTAKVGIAFRSHTIDRATFEQTSDSSSNWTMQGQVACSLPLDAEIACRTAFHCSIAATGDNGTSAGMTLLVTKQVDEKEKCGG